MDPANNDPTNKQESMSKQPLLRSSVKTYKYHEDDIYYNNHPEETSIPYYSGTPIQPAPSPPIDAKALILRVRQETHRMKQKTRLIQSRFSGLDRMAIQWYGNQPKWRRGPEPKWREQALGVNIIEQDQSTTDTTAASTTTTTTSTNSSTNSTEYFSCAESSTSSISSNWWRRACRVSSLSWFSLVYCISV